MKSLFEQKNNDVTLSMGAMWGGVAAGEGKEQAISWLVARLDEIPQACVRYRGKSDPAERRLARGLQ